MQEVLDMRITFRCHPDLKGILPEPVLAKKGLPEWLKKMPMNAHAVDWGVDVKTVKQCPPFIDAMSCGFMILLPCDIQVDKGLFDWSWDEMPMEFSDPHTARSPLGVHPIEQATGTPLYDEDSIVIKFMSHWIIELEPGYSLLATHPINRPYLPFQTLTGLVDSDVYKSIYINFPAIWTDREFTGVLKKGTRVD